MANFILSASSLTTFLRCGLQWRMAYIDGIKSPPSLRAARGIAVHKAVEVDFAQKKDTQTDLPVDDMLDAYSDSYDTEISGGFRVDNKRKEEPGEVKDKGVGLVKLFHRDVAPKIQPVIVEEPIKFKINGIDWTGQIDYAQRVPVLDKKTKTVDYKLEVRDVKSTSRAPQPEQYTTNMVGYAISQRQATGEVEADVVLDYLVATKMPRHQVVRRGGPVTDDQIRQFSKTVGYVADTIKARKFVPNGLINGACGWCGFTAQCPAYLKQNPNE